MQYYSRRDIRHAPHNKNIDPIDLPFEEPNAEPIVKLKKKPKSLLSSYKVYFVLGIALFFVSSNIFSKPTKNINTKTEMEKSLLSYKNDDLPVGNEPGINLDEVESWVGENSFKPPTREARPKGRQAINHKPQISRKQVARHKPQVVSIQKKQFVNKPIVKIVKNTTTVKPKQIVIKPVKSITPKVVRQVKPVSKPRTIAVPKPIVVSKSIPPKPVETMMSVDDEIMLRPLRVSN